MRLFLAINLAPELRRAIVDAASDLRDVAPSVSWVDDTRLHLTLKFLGEQPPEWAEPIARAVDAVTVRHKPFAMRIEHVGAFPNFRRARVVWMGIEREPRLELLHHDVEVACQALGFELEGRAFRPHLTLGRIKAERVEADELRKLSRASKRVTFAHDTVVESIDLMKSNHSAAERYELLHSSPMRRV